MEPEAVAIKLDPLKVAPEKLLGTTPYVIFTDQGAAPAGLERETLPKLGGTPEKAFEISDVVVVIDRSGSMGASVSSNDRRQKLALAKEELGRLTDTLPDTRITLIPFNNGASVQTITAGGGATKWETLVQEVSGIRPAGGTLFVPALKEVNSILASSPLESRKVVFFLTDGLDGDGLRDSDSLTARQLSRMEATIARSKNALTFLIGVGADWDLDHVIRLSGKFGFSGWAHIPMDDGRSVFRDVIPQLLREVQSAEHYLRIKPVGDQKFPGFFGLTPAIRRASSSGLSIGYQNNGIGVLFGREDPELSLEIARHSGDKNPTTRSIQIVEGDAAAAHYEKLQIARGAVPPVLILQAQLKGDMELLKSLRDAYPGFKDQIEGLLANSGSDEADRVAGLSVTGGLGGSVWDLSQILRAGRDPDSGKQVNQLSRVSNPGNLGGKPGKVGPAHSGGIGPLDQPFDEPPNLGKPNAGAYTDASKKGDRVLRIYHPDSVETFNLGTFSIGDKVVIGSGSSASFKINEQGVAARHLEIEIKADGYYIKKMGIFSSKVMVNGEKLSSVRKLNPGDKITFGSCELKFE